MELAVLGAVSRVLPGGPRGRRLHDKQKNKPRNLSKEHPVLRKSADLRVQEMVRAVPWSSGNRASGRAVLRVLPGGPGADDNFKTSSPATPRYIFNTFSPLHQS